ncbi:MAG TPA: bis-aminopropyl spermidine synthase family protein, partial [Sandaracinaceae bacterium]
MTSATAAKLGELLAGRSDATPARVSEAVAALLARHGCARPPPGADDESDARHALYWLLRMAERTHRRAVRPLAPVDGALVARFEALAQGRPGRDAAHGQLHVDTASTIRRAEIVRTHLARCPGPVLAVGDDDLVTLALAMMGVAELFAVDIDERILAFLAERAAHAGGRIEVRRVDVLEEPVPAALRQRCAAVIA